METPVNRIHLGHHASPRRATPSLVTRRQSVDDAFLKRTFAHARPVELLIRRHLPKWADKVGFATLEALPTELIGDKLGRRHTDTAWRARSLDGGTDYVFILEFQGRPERAMVLRTNIYGSLAAQRLFEQDREFGQGGRGLAVACIVLYHGDRPWNAPKNLRDLFEDVAPDTYHLVERRPPDAPPPRVLDLPQVVLGLAGTSAFRRMRAELPVLLRLVKACGDEDFERYMARAVRAMLRSRGIHSEELEGAMSMDTVAAAFRRSLEEYKQECREEGMRRGREQGVRQGREQGQVKLLRQQAARKFGLEAAEQVSRLLASPPNPVLIARISAAVLECDGPEEFLARVRGG